MDINTKCSKVWDLRKDEDVWGQGWDLREVGYISGYRWSIR